MIAAKASFQFSIPEEIVRETDAVQELVEMHYALISETYTLEEQCYEAHFLDPKAFEALCFFVVCYRKFDVDQEMLDTSLALFDVAPKKLFDSIKILFGMHTRPAPHSLLEVVRDLSGILPRT
ncbi:MAG TPA: hypothetical protein VKK79_16430 [Candidatus Lokiarchaeia archaeon]|nr:hypothetical protein [Candidatus Lokiarchaeia archaeon]